VFVCQGICAYQVFLTPPWWLFKYRNTSWPNLQNWYINEIKMTGESELVMKPTSKNVWCQDRKESIYGKTRWKDKRRPNFRWLDCGTIWNRWESRDGGSKQKTDLYGLSFWRRHWLIKLWGSLVNEEVNK